ncbi:hypothetical protein M758_3G014600 [Ceratodon purpureus]|uniref:Uncharacterized protein n=1 Tax=Ceratodon purpureus TaxID=3225 RepID=A0A8T0IEQ8_CERPU|nr:hypothetical protein KC19_3G014500 [Ceratodon purpureus]KAG0621369.1 hypothetical protein M758_3G014600 [Ceratodon purpureus]
MATLAAFASWADKLLMISGIFLILTICCCARCDEKVANWTTGTVTIMTLVGET